MISIVIVNWNSGNLLRACAQSIVTHAPNAEVVVVDNASVDTSLDFIDQFPNISIIKNGRNLGYAAASNLGWRAAKGEFILLLNPDSECLPKSVAMLEQTLLESRSAWAVGGRLVSASGEPQSKFNVRKFPTISNLAAEMMMLDGIIPSLQGYVPNGSEVADVDQPAAACLMISRKALELIGGFDEQFVPAWFEDVDLCRRIRNKGGRILYQPAARFLHQGGYSLQRLSREEFLTHFHRNQIRYFHKHFGMKAASQAKRWITAGLRLRSILSLIHSPFPEQSRSAAAKIFWSSAKRITKSGEAGA